MKNRINEINRPDPEYPRRYLSQNLNLSNWEELKPIALELVSREWDSLGLFNRWLEDWFEFSNAVSEESNRLYIYMTCDTTDKDKDNAYVNFLENVVPELEKLENSIHLLIDSSEYKPQLPADIYYRYLRSISISLKIFTVKNIPLNTSISKLSQEYQKISGSLTVNWEGKTLSLTQLSPVLQENNREKREKAWRLISQRRLYEAPVLDKNFDQAFKYRKQVAANLGLEDYRDYIFKKYERDYTPEDCFKFHDTVEQVAVPLYKKVLDFRRQKLGLKTLRPWDLSCHPMGKSSLKPFKTPDKLLAGVQGIFTDLDAELSGFFNIMKTRGLLDLENRIGKAPGGYQASLDEVRLPFIFMNAVGSNTDVFTLLHEGGHSFHQFLTRHMALSRNRQAPMEFAEVASMSMERFGHKYLNHFYSPAEINQAIAAEDEEVFRLLCWVAMVDGFQHWLYTHPHHTHEERNAYWVRLDQKYGGGVDWSGLETYRDIYWHRQLHIFEMPFYYIEYGIAQIGALQMWYKSLQDEAGALASYKKGLSLGGTKSLPELFSAAGLHFDFSPSVVEPLLTALYKQWEQTVEHG